MFGSDPNDDNRLKRLAAAGFKAFPGECQGNFPAGTMSVEPQRQLNHKFLLEQTLQRLVSV